MSGWRREALVQLPEFRKLIEQSKNPYSLWNELRSLFQQAVDQINRDLTWRILNYGRYCLEAGGNRACPVRTAAVVCFYEHLPERRKDWPLLKGWVEPEMFDALQGAFTYQLGADGFEELKKVYYQSLGYKPKRPNISDSDNRTKEKR